MNEEVIIRQYKPGDENGIICLLETVFDGWPHKDLQCTPLDHWRWKYEDNPLKSNAVAVAECAGKIVGCTHGLFMNVKIGKKVQLAQQGMDLAVDEDLRGRGMHPKITDLKRKIMIEKNINITFSTSGHPIVIRHDRDRPQFPSPLMQMIKIRDVDQHLKMVDYSNKLTKKYGYLGLRTLKRVKNRLTAAQSPTSNLEISEIGRFDEQIDGFWGEIEDNYSFIIERDMNYLNWRYCEKRGGDFKIMQATAGDKILGYMALRINRYRKEYPVGIIAGLLTLPGRPEVADALTCYAEKYFRDQGVNIVEVLAVKGHSYERVFERQYFIRSPTKHILFYKPFNLDKMELNDFMTAPPEKLHFEYGDLDTV